LPSTWVLLAESVEFAGNVCIGIFFYLFPSGQFVPRWASLLMIIWIAYWANSSFFPNTAFTHSAFDFILLIILVASLIIFQIYRYRRVSTHVQRQQTKWVIFGIVLAFGSFLIEGTLLYLRMCQN